MQVAPKDALVDGSLGFIFPIVPCPFDDPAEGGLVVVKQREAGVVFVADKLAKRRVSDDVADQAL